MSLFLRPKKGSRTWPKGQPEQSASSPRTELYHSCAQLPLDRFINCLVDGDLSQLKIKGNPTDAQLAEAWEKIYIEYIELNQSNESQYVIRLESEISLLDDEVKRVQEIIYLLSPAMIKMCDGREGELVELLRGYGYKQTIDFNSDYTRVLLAIQNKLNPKKLRLQTRINELIDYLKVQVTGKPDRSVFDTNLSRMSRFQGYPVRAKETTVREYVIIFKDCIAANSKSEREGVS